MCYKVRCRAFLSSIILATACNNDPPTDTRSHEETRESDDASNGPGSSVAASNIPADAFGLQGTFVHANSTISQTSPGSLTHPTNSRALRVNSDPSTKFAEVRFIATLQRYTNSKNRKLCFLFDHPTENAVANECSRKVYPLEIGRYSPIIGHTNVGCDTTHQTCTSLHIWEFDIASNESGNLGPVYTELTPPSGMKILNLALAPSYEKMNVEITEIQYESRNEILGCTPTALTTCALQTFNDARAKGLMRVHLSKRPSLFQSLSAKAGIGLLVDGNPILNLVSNSVLGAHNAEFAIGKWKAVGTGGGGYYEFEVSRIMPGLFTAQLAIIDPIFPHRPPIIKSTIEKEFNAMYRTVKPVQGTKDFYILDTYGMSETAFDCRFADNSSKQGCKIVNGFDGQLLGECNASNGAPTNCHNAFVPTASRIISPSLSSQSVSIRSLSGRDSAAFSCSKFFSHSFCQAEIYAKEVSYTNPLNPYDVNDDGMVSPLDALLVINAINAKIELTSKTPNVAPFLDVSHDGALAPNDVLQVINRINIGSSGN